MEQEREKEIQAKGLNAPRLSPADIDKVIVGRHFFNPPGMKTTICILELANGHEVVGYSAPVSKENFDIDIGQQRAFERAREQIWALEGYLLQAIVAGHVVKSGAG